VDFNEYKPSSISDLIPDIDHFCGLHASQANVVINTIYQVAIGLSDEYLNELRRIQDENQRQDPDRHQYKIYPLPLIRKQVKSNETLIISWGIKNNDSKFPKTIAKSNKFEYTREKMSKYADGLFLDLIMDYETKYRQLRKTYRNLILIRTLVGKFNKDLSEVNDVT